MFLGRVQGATYCATLLLGTVLFGTWPWPWYGEYVQLAMYCVCSPVHL